MINFFIWPIDGTLTSTTTPGLSGPGSNGDELGLLIPQTAKMELHHQMILCQTQVTGKVQRCSLCILYIYIYIYRIESEIIFFFF